MTNSKSQTVHQDVGPQPSLGDRRPPTSSVEDHCDVVVVCNPLGPRIACVLFMLGTGVWFVCCGGERRVIGCLDPYAVRESMIANQPRLSAPI